MIHCSGTGFSMILSAQFSMPAFSIHASSMVSLSNPDSLTMNHGTVWTVRVDTIWPHRNRTIGRKWDAKSWASVQVEVQTINLPTFHEHSSASRNFDWGIGQMAHGHQKCTPMCTRSWSGSQKSYPDLVRCPGQWWKIYGGKCSTTNPIVGHSTETLLLTSTAGVHHLCLRTPAFAILRFRSIMNYE